MKVELPDANGSNVIVLEVVRRERYVEHLKKHCAHRKVYIEQGLATIQCQECGKDLNPVEWLAMMTQEWHRVQRLYEDYKEAKRKLEERTRTKCRHCGQFTPVR